MSLVNTTTQEIEEELKRRKNLAKIKNNGGTLHNGYYVTTITEMVERLSGGIRENNEEPQYYYEKETFTFIYDSTGNFVKSFYSPLNTDLTDTAVNYINKHLTPEAIQRRLEAITALKELEDKLILANYNKDRVRKEIERLKGNVGIS